MSNVADVLMPIDRFTGCRGDGATGWRATWCCYAGRCHCLPQTVSVPSCYGQYSSPSVCLSVSPPLTGWHYVESAERIIELFTNLCRNNYSFFAHDATATAKVRQNHPRAEAETTAGWA